VRLGGGGVSQSAPFVGAAPRREQRLRGLAAGLLGCALLTLSTEFSRLHPRYEQEDWRDFTAGVGSYLGSGTGDTGQGSGDPGGAIDYATQIAQQKIAELHIQSWQFWRTIQARPFVAERTLLTSVRRDGDPGRASLLALGFRALGGVSPFLLRFLGALAAFPLLILGALELFDAGHAVAGIVYPCTVASLPLVVDGLSRPAVFQWIALMAVVPLGAYAISARASVGGVCLRAAVALTAIGLCTLGKPALAAFLPGLGLGVLLALWRVASTSRDPGPVYRPVALVGTLLAFVLLEVLVRRAILPGIGGLETRYLLIVLAVGLSLTVDAAFGALVALLPPPSREPEGRPISGRKAVVFWAVMLVLPLATTLFILEIVIRAVTEHGAPTDEASLQRQLERSQSEEVTEVRNGNLLGLVRPSAWKDIVYELKPSREWVFLRAQVKTNSHGFRGREYDVVKGSKTFRILGIGDSVMFGWGVDDEQTYTALLEKDLTCEMGSPAEVLNFGVPGYNTVQEVGLFREKCLAFDPDVVVINYVLNDWAAPFLLRDPTDQNSLVMRSRLLEIVRRRLHREPTADDYFANPGLRGVFASLHELAGLAGKRHVPVVFFIYPQALDLKSQESFRTRVTEEGFLYVDMYQAFDRYCKAHHLRGTEAFDLSWNDTHPNAEGHRLMAATLKPVLLTLARQKRH
jgi:lysophospholipase L1-like esterase